MRAKKLTAAFARTVSEAGKYGDAGGAGLALLVKPTGRKVKRMQAIPTFRSAAESVIALYAPSWAPGGKSEAQSPAGAALFEAAGCARQNSVSPGTTCGPLGS